MSENIGAHSRYNLTHIDYILGLSSKGEKLEAPKADQIKSDKVAGEVPNLNGLDADTLQKILAAAGKAAEKSPELANILASGAVAEGKKDAKLEQGLQQILGGGEGLAKKAESNLY